MMTRCEIDDALIANYFNALINKFYKILPIREGQGNDATNSLTTYMESLKSELVGCSHVIHSVNADPDYATLIFILQDLIDDDERAHNKVKREVFHSISICKKLITRYGGEDDCVG